MLTLDELREDVESGAVDTVIACFTDMQGRLMGKRLDAEFFLAENEAGHPGEGCNYLLALEMEMDPVPGYAIASWERGYGDFGLRPDLSTLRRIPWHEATVMVQCDVEWHDGTPVAPSPRQVLRAQVEKAHGSRSSSRCSARSSSSSSSARPTSRRTPSTTTTSRPRCRTSSTTTSSRRASTSRSSARCGRR